MTEIRNSGQTSAGIPLENPPDDQTGSDYSIGQDNIEGKFGPIGFDIHNPVFAVSALTVVAFVAYTLIMPEQANSVFSLLFSKVTKGFDWFFISAADIFVILCFVIVISPYGKIRLGDGKQNLTSAT